jgi:5-methylcytosine-specific restriction endonuclease McrA
MPHKKLSEEHKRKISESQKGRIFSEEHKRKISEACKGRPNGMLGKKHSIETRHFLSELNTGKHHSEEAKRKISESLRGNTYNLGKKHTEETKSKMSSKRRGGNNGNWRGGITSVAHRIRTSFRYKEWRQQIFIRDDFTCQKCGARGVYLHAHHKIPFAKLTEQVRRLLPLFDLYDGAMIYKPLWDIDNGITLCKKCHLL